MYSCQFGTFLFNCEKDRVAEKAGTRTVSFWSWVNARTHLYKNPYYQPSPMPQNGACAPELATCDPVSRVCGVRVASHVPPLTPSTAPQDLVFWKRYYLRYHHNMPQDPREAQVDTLRVRLAELERESRAAKDEKLRALIVQSETPS